MRILFDQGTPAPLRHALVGHSVSLLYEMGWSELDNGKLLAAAEESFDVLVTTDQSLRYQQNLSKRRLAILILPTTNWFVIREYGGRVLHAVSGLSAGDIVELQFE